VDKIGFYPALIVTKAKRGNPAPSWRIAPTDEPRLNIWKEYKWKQ